MSLDLNSQQTLSLTEASRTLLPKSGGRPMSPATLHRWVRDGVLAGDGTRVRLSAVRVGRAFVTTEPAVRSFLNELARRSRVKPAAAPLSDEVDADLKNRGLL